MNDVIVLSCISKSCQHPNTSRYHEQKEIARITDQCPIINQSTGSVFTAMCPFFQSLKKEKNARNQIEYHHTKNTFFKHTTKKERKRTQEIKLEKRETKARQLLRPQPHASAYQSGPPTRTQTRADTKVHGKQLSARRT